MPKPQMSDIITRNYPAEFRADTEKNTITGVPIVDGEKKLKGLLTSKIIGNELINGDFTKLKTSYDNIIIDEVSMIDNHLMDSLLRGLTNNIKLVLVGDYNQLPSVGAGNILKDLIDSDIVDKVELDLLYRQDGTSYIPVLANEIKNETLEEDFLIDRDDYKFLECSNDAIIPSLVNISKKVISKGYDYKRVQLMAPMYAGVNGIDNINKVLQDVFNPIELNKKEIKYGDIIYRENDKVLQLVNDPDNNVFNGDIGIIKNIEYKGKSGGTEITIDYYGNLVTYKQKEFNKFKLLHTNKPPLVNLNNHHFFKTNNPLFFTLIL